MLVFFVFFGSGVADHALRLGPYNPLAAEWQKSPRSNMVAPNAALSSTARWGAALEISASRNTAVSSVGKDHPRHGNH